MSVMEATVEMADDKGSLLVMIRNAWRENMAPGFAIQTLALLLAGTYYFVPAVRQFWDAVAGYKHEYSLVAAMLSTAVCGGIIPFIYLKFSGRAAGMRTLANFAFVSIFWAWKGGEVEMFYRLQAWMFGDSNAMSVIVCKVLVDQFVYNPFWAAHTVLIGLTWQHCDFSMKNMIFSLKGHYWKEMFPGILISTWMVWIPAVSIIYCLPQALQIPMFNLVLCFFVLLASALKKR